MSLRSYGVLVGHALATAKDKDDSPHYHIHLSDQEDWDISINVKSGVLFSTVDRPGVPPNQVLYLLQDPFEHPILEELSQLDTGFHPLESKPGGLAVDYIRGNFFDPADMKPLPHQKEGENNDLFERIGFYAEKAVRESDALVYAFGEPWPKSDKSNYWFKFQPNQGVHDVHMNQGNDPAHVRDDGVWQDGALFIRFSDRWVALFIAFQAQCWHTDDVTGAADPDCAAPPAPPTTTSALPEAMILAATVNPVGADSGLESVILLNTTGKDIPLEGWNIADKNKKREPLQGVLRANDVLKVVLSGRGAQLSNKGGIISLLSPKGHKVHGVSYVRDQAKKSGLTFPFNS